MNANNLLSLLAWYHTPTLYTSTESISDLPAYFKGDHLYVGFGFIYVVLATKFAHDLLLFHHNLKWLHLIGWLWWLA